MKLRDRNFRSLFSLALAIPVFLVSVKCYSQEYDFLTFTTDDGLPQSYVYSMCQDSLGRLWVSTGDGLSRYDGFSFTRFGAGDSLPDNFVTCSLTDGQKLWFGHAGGSISWYDGKEFRIIDPGIENAGRITHMSFGPGRLLWVSSSSGGMAGIERSSAKIVRRLMPGSEMISTFHFITENELLLGTASGLHLCRIDYKGDLFEQTLVADMPESRISAIIRCNDGSGCFVATENEGIYKVALKEQEIKIYPVSLPDGTRLNGVQSLCEDNQSNLWAGTFGNGLVKITPGQDPIIRVFNRKNGFVTDNVRTIFEDREGILWCGNFGEGLTRTTLKTFLLLRFDAEKYGNNIFSLFSDEQSRWIGTDRGLICIDRKTNTIDAFYGKLNGFPEDSVTSIYCNKSHVWAGTAKHGVMMIDKTTGEISRCETGEGLLENSITALTGYRDFICIGTKKGLCILDPGSDNKRWYTIKQGLSHNHVISLYADTEQRLWVSTKSRTLSYIIDREVHKISLNMGSGMVTSGPVISDPQARIWIGSGGGGVFIVETDSVLNLTSHEGLISDYCYSMTFDGHYIWTGHKGGLSRIDITDFSVKPFRRFEGLSDLYFNNNAAAIEPMGQVLFGSDKGLVSVNHLVDSRYPEPPVAGIISVRVNDEEHEFENGRIMLPPGNYKVRIDYLATSLLEPDLVSYQSMLEGFDTDWSDITKDRYVIYPKLADGKYTFVLKSANGDGVVTRTPLKLSIVINKPLWKKWWFYPLMIALWTFVVFLLLKQREKRLLREKRNLEEKVKERTREIEHQKNEIEKQRDEIDEKNSNITSSITYARQIQKALLPPLEILERNLPENFIMHRPKDIVSGDFYWMAEKDNKLIFTVADCTGHGVPGAFMSLLGITLLNEIVNIHGITNSDQIVNELRRRVILSLQQNRGEVRTRDGMDISLCVLDKRNGKIQFTGGMNDMVRIREGKLEIIKADHLDVSVSYQSFGDFSMKEIDCRKGDMLYLFTDGYQDQFGGEYDRKFLRPHFYTTLVEIHRQPVLNQKEMLEKKLASWMKSRRQTDDITVMGIRLQ